MIGTARPLPQPADDLEAVQVGKTEIEDHEVGLTRRGLEQPLLAGLGLHHAVALARQRGAEEPADGRLVLDDQHDRASAPVARPRHGSPAAPRSQPSSVRTSGGSAASGRKKRNTAPPPGRDSARIRPPWASTIPRAMASPRPGPAARPGGVAAVELLEDERLLAGREPRPAIGDHHVHLAVLDGGRDLDRASLGRVLDGVVQNVDEHLLDEEGIEGHQRQVGGQVDVDTAIAETLLHADQRAADHLFQGLPVLSNPDAAGLEPRHLEQVLHQAVQAVGLLVNRLRELASRRGVEARLLLDQSAGRAGDGRQRGAEIVGDGAEQGVPESLRLGAEVRLLSLVHQRHALDREGGLGGEGLEEMELLRRCQGRLGRHRLDAEDSHRAARGRQWEVQGPGTRQGGAAATCQLTVFVRPLGDGALTGLVGSRAQRARPGDQPAVGVREEYRDAAREDFRDVARRRSQQLVETLLTDQIARHRVEGGGPALALARELRVRLDAGRERADHDGHGQHDRERDDVLGVGHREGQEGSDEEEVEGRDAEDGRQNGGASPEAPRREHRAQEVDHDEVGGREVAEHERRQPGAGGDDRHGLGVAGPVDGRRGALGCGRLRPLALPGDDVDVDVAAPPDQLVDDRAEQDFPPARARRLAQDDAGDVAAPCVGEDLRARRRARSA